MVYINKGEHENPHELPPKNSDGSLSAYNTVYTHTKSTTTLPEEIEKLEYIYQHFQDCEKIHEMNPHLLTEQIDDMVYPQINNDIKYGLFENIIDSYYLDSQIRDDFTCTKACYTHNHDNNILDTKPPCTHTYDHISQQLNPLADTEQQHKVYMSEEDASLFTSDTSTQYTFNIIPSTLETEAENHTKNIPEQYQHSFS